MLGEERRGCREESFVRIAPKSHRMRPRVLAGVLCRSTSAIFFNHIHDSFFPRTRDNLKACFERVCRACVVLLSPLMWQIFGNPEL